MIVPFFRNISAKMSLENVLHKPLEKTNNVINNHDIEVARDSVQTKLIRQVFIVK